MDQLNSLYVQLLHAGFLALREAASSNDPDRLDAEIEFLHNVPSLVGEQNVERHRYFWCAEREHYVQWVKGSGNDRAHKFVRVFYEPIWTEIAPILSDWFSRSSTPATPSTA